MADIILDKESFIYRHFGRLVARADRVFFSGVPGVGKSFLLQQLVLMAQEAGRKVYILQWDTTRSAFETPEILAKYPEIDGVTHAVIRKAVGMWTRQGVAEWDQTHKKPEYMLIGEVPLVGNRLIELAQPHEDEVEAMLSDVRTQFMTPVPTVKVREAIEARREKTIADPQHEKETKDAPPNVLRDLWHDLYRLAGELGLTDAKAETMPYSPDIYRAVYHHLLQHRYGMPFDVDQVYAPTGSAYDLGEIEGELLATPEQVQSIMGQLEAKYSVEEIEEDVAHWYEV